MKQEVYTFSQTCDTVFGVGAIKQVGVKAKELGMTKVLIVTDEGLVKAGVPGQVQEYLKAEGIDSAIFKDNTICKDTEIKAGADMFHEIHADGIIGVGGGASLDCAKGILVLAGNPWPLYQYYLSWDYEVKYPLIAIPTTSGTGSENTIYSVTTYTGEDIPERKLISGNKADLLVKASLAICDPELTVKLPAHLTASTGMDAFAHAAESMTCITPNPKSDCLDMEAIRLIVKWLPIAVKDPENIEARYNMMLASTFAGMGFSDALVHLGHAFSECMGAKFHVAHGISCAWGLPETMTYASKYRGDKVRMVADAMGLTVPEGATDEEVGQIVADAIRAFMKGIGVRSIKESGFTREDTVSIYTSIPKNLCWPSLPQPLSDDELKAWLGRVYDTYQ